MGLVIHIVMHWDRIGLHGWDIFGLRVLSSLSNGLALISSFVSKFPIVDVVTCLNGYWIRLNRPLLLDNLNNSMGC